VNEWGAKKTPKKVWGSGRRANLKRKSRLNQRGGGKNETTLFKESKTYYDGRENTAFLPWTQRVRQMVNRESRKLAEKVREGNTI